MGEERSGPAPAEPLDWSGPHAGILPGIICFRGPKATCAHFTISEAMRGYRRGKAAQRGWAHAARGQMKPMR